MDLVLNGGSPLPIYRQIFDQICAQVLEGSLKSGDALPPIRTVAAELRISVITVKRAWEELEREGLIETFVGRGCFIAPLTEEKRSLAKKALAREKLIGGAAYCRALGINKEEALSLFAESYEDAAREE